MKLHLQIFISRKISIDRVINLHHFLFCDFYDIVCFPPKRKNTLQFFVFYMQKDSFESYKGHKSQANNFFDNYLFYVNICVYSLKMNEFSDILCEFVIVS